MVSLSELFTPERQVKPMAKMKTVSLDDCYAVLAEQKRAAFKARRKAAYLRRINRNK